MITTAGHERLKKYVQDSMKEGKYFIGQTGHTVPIYKTERNGDEITFYLYLADDVVGNITKFQLLDKDGQVFDDQPDNIEKLQINGLLVSFVYKVTITKG